MFKRKPDEPIKFRATDTRQDPYVLSLYQGCLPGRGERSYCYHCLRKIPRYRYNDPETAGKPTHEFKCWYSDFSGKVHVLFQLWIDCRLGRKVPDAVALAITDFLVYLLTAQTAEGAIGTRILLESGDSTDFWEQAIAKKLADLQQPSKSKPFPTIPPWQ